MASLKKLKAWWFVPAPAGAGEVRFTRGLAIRAKRMEQATIVRRPAAKPCLRLV